MYTVVMERHLPMSLPRISRSFFYLYLTFEITKYFISLIGYRKTSNKLEANCVCSISEIIIIKVLQARHHFSHGIEKVTCMLTTIAVISEFGKYPLNIKVLVNACKYFQRLSLNCYRVHIKKVILL